MRVDTINKSKIIEVAFRLVLGLTFIYASIGKIADPSGFSAAVHNFGATPIYIENIIALYLPWIELIIGFGLILGIFYKASLNIMITLLIVFTLLILQAYLRGKSIDCGCFMNELSLEKRSEVRADMLGRVVEDIILLAMAVFLKYRLRLTVANDKD